LSRTCPTVASPRPQTVSITAFEQDREIAWTILGQIKPQIGHVYGYRLEPADGATLVTSYYDWSGIDQVWRDAGIFPVISEGALRATLGILARTVAGKWAGHGISNVSFIRPARSMSEFGG